MASRRMILRSDLESRQFKKLGISQRYLYWALTLLADDDGICSYDLIEGRIFFVKDGLSPEDINQELSDLEVAGYILNYQDEEKEKYIFITKWWDKQFIAKNIYKTTEYPIPPRGYLARPDDLKKGIRPSLYNSSREPLDKVRLGKDRIGKDSSVEDSVDLSEYPLG